MTASDAQQPASDAPAAKAPRKLLLSVTAFAMIVAAAGYAAFGSPHALRVEPTPPQATGPTPAEREQIDQMVQRLATRLEQKPDDFEGWLMLARSYLVLDRPGEALRAFEKLREFKPDDPKLESAITQLRAIVAAGGGSPAQPPPAGAPARTAAAGGTSAAAGSSAAAPVKRGSVGGRVELAAALAGKAPAKATLFVFAYAVDGPRIPLAVLRLPADKLPATFTLDDSAAMNPAFRISIATQVIVGARISASGQAIAQPGDLQGFSGVVPLGTKDLVIEIKDVVTEKPARGAASSPR